AATSPWDARPASRASMPGSTIASTSTRDTASPGSCRRKRSRRAFRRIVRSPRWVAEQGGIMQIGVDIGGTFTDIVALGADGRLTATKVPTTPKDLLVGVAEAVRRVLTLAGAEPAAVARFIHGTTVATNAVLEQKGAVTGILATEGFEDVL